MTQTFREKVLTAYKRLARKYHWLRYPALFFAAILLLGDGFVCHLKQNYKRYFSMAFTCLVFVFSCSFTGAVFNTENVYFMDNTQTVSVAMDSDIELAVEKEVSPIEIDDSDVSQDIDHLDSEVDINSADVLTVDDLMADVDYLEESVAIDAPKTSVFDPDDWKLLLINKQHPIPETFELHLGVIKGNMQCDERIIPDLVAMFQAAKDDGVDLVVCSPYRDLNRQEMLFERKIKKYMAQGMSYMDAYKTASQAVTVPGASEHQIGLALDIISTTYSTLDEGFGDTKAGQWLAEHSCEYGFILRYPKGKEYVTGIEFEPWHFRYVGIDAAEVISRNGITLEEFWSQYIGRVE